MKRIPYGKQSISKEDIDAVVKTLQSDYLTQGPRIKEFEDAFARYTGSQYAVAVANATAALHLSTLILEVKPGDRVITTPITFVASANCVRYCGAEVVFADINRETYLLDINKVRKILEASPAHSFKGIIPVDFAGLPVDLEDFRKLADEYGLWIIEDACHAPGGWFKDTNGNHQKCGNGEFADLAIFSFHPVKHIAAGEGGMITTNSNEIYQKLLTLRTHGITRDSNLFLNNTSFAAGVENADRYPGWYMEMQNLGYNYRLTDFQAALGLSQLQRAEQGLAKRRAIAQRYDEAFRGNNGIKSKSWRSASGELAHAYHLYIIEVQDRFGLYNYLQSQNIFAQIHYIPCHLMPYYRHRGWAEGDLPNAENYYKHCLSLPMYPTLADEEQDIVIKSVLDYV